MGSPFKVNREYAERFAERWVVLSAKYGFIDPHFVIPETYNVTFKDKSTNPIGDSRLQEQIQPAGLDRYETVVSLGGKEYSERTATAFSATSSKIICPFAGLIQGKMMQATKNAIFAGQPFPPSD